MFYNTTGTTLFSSFETVRGLLVLFSSLINVHAARSQDAVSVSDPACCMDHLAQIQSTRAAMYSVSVKSCDLYLNSLRRPYLSRTRVDGQSDQTLEL